MSHSGNKAGARYYTEAASQAGYSDPQPGGMAGYTDPDAYTCGAQSGLPQGQPPYPQQPTYHQTTGTSNYQDAQLPATSQQPYPPGPAPQNSRHQAGALGTFNQPNSHQSQGPPLSDSNWQNFQPQATPPNISAAGMSNQAYDQAYGRFPAPTSQQQSQDPAPQSRTQDSNQMPMPSNVPRAGTARPSNRRSTAPINRSYVQSQASQEEGWNPKYQPRAQPFNAETGQKDAAPSQPRTQTALPIRPRTGPSRGDTSTRAPGIKGLRTEIAPGRQSYRIGSSIDTVSANTQKPKRALRMKMTTMKTKMTTKRRVRRRKMRRSRLPLSLTLTNLEMRTNRSPCSPVLFLQVPGDCSA